MSNLSKAIILVKILLSNFWPCKLKIIFSNIFLQGKVLIVTSWLVGESTQILMVLVKSAIGIHNSDILAIVFGVVYSLMDVYMMYIVNKFRVLLVITRNVSVLYINFNNA